MKALDYMSYFESWAQGTACYEQLYFVYDMNESGSYELRALDAMSN